MTHAEPSTQVCKVRKQPSVLRPLNEYLYYSSNRDALGELLSHYSPEQLLAVGADPGVVGKDFPSASTKLRTRDTFVILESDKQERNCVKPIGMVAVSPVVERRSRGHKKIDNRLISAWVDTNALEPTCGTLTLSGFAYNVVATAIDIARHKGADAVCMIDRSSGSDCAGGLVALDRLVADPAMLEFGSQGIKGVVSDGRFYVAELWTKSI